MTSINKFISDFVTTQKDNSEYINNQKIIIQTINDKYTENISTLWGKLISIITLIVYYLSYYKNINDMDYPVIKLLENNYYIFNGTNYDTGIVIDIKKYSLDRIDSTVILNYYNVDNDISSTTYPSTTNFSAHPNILQNDININSSFTILKNLETYLIQNNIIYKYNNNSSIIKIYPTIYSIIELINNDVDRIIFRPTIDTINKITKNKILFNLETYIYQNFDPYNQSDTTTVPETIEQHGYTLYDFNVTNNFPSLDLLYTIKKNYEEVFWIYLTISTPENVNILNEIKNKYSNLLKFFIEIFINYLLWLQLLQTEETIKLTLDDIKIIFNRFGIY